MFWSKPVRPRDRGVLWLVPLFMAVHNAEEAIFFPRYLPLVLERLPVAWRAIAAPLTLTQMWAALAAVTLLPFAFAVWASLRPDLAAPVWCLLVIQLALLLNALWHISVAIFVFRGYAPGLVTAVLVNLPFSLYLLGRAVKENWVFPRLPGPGRTSVSHWHRPH